MQLCFFAFGHIGHGLKYINGNNKKIANKKTLKTSNKCIENIQKEKRTPRIKLLVAPIPRFNIDTSLN